VRNCGTRFYLTGGTAISRAYYHHRYSDDLDFFTNSDPEYNEQVDAIYAALQNGDFFVDAGNSIRNDSFASLYVGWDKSDAVLKLDFVNDIPAHFGGFVSTPLFNRVDSIRNILSNKLGALFRFAGKDIADIREIALHETIDWAAIIEEARQKDAGLELPVIAEIMQGIPKPEFDAIMWRGKPDYADFMADINRIALAMARCSSS
jgi:predicted nucleotidyltransferase component of viral defense system